MNLAYGLRQQTSLAWQDPSIASTTARPEEVVWPATHDRKGLLTDLALQDTAHLAEEITGDVMSFVSREVLNCAVVLAMLKVGELFHWGDHGHP